MTTTINASTAAGGGLINSADASGILALQTGGTTAMTIDGSQNVAAIATTAWTPEVVAAYEAQVAAAAAQGPQA